MKEYLFLYKESNNRYYSILNFPNTSLNFLNGYFEIDYKYYYEEYLFNNLVSSFNEYFIYNDREKKMLYIGWAEWEIDEEIDSPSEDEFPAYVNKTNSCKIGVDNFIEFIQKWVELKIALPPFAIIYRDDNDWIDCKGFDTQEEMDQFVKDQQSQTIHL